MFRYHSDCIDERNLTTILYDTRNNEQKKNDAKKKFVIVDVKKKVIFGRQRYVERMFLAIESS